MLRAGNGVRSLADSFGLSKSAIDRHRLEHLAPARKAKRPTALSASLEAAPIETAPAASPSSAPIVRTAVVTQTSPREMAERLTRSVLAQIERVETRKDLTEVAIAKILASASTTVGVLGKITGQTRDVSERTIVASAAWQRIQNAMIKALSPWPEAMRAAGEQIQALGEET